MAAHCTRERWWSRDGEGKREEEEEEEGEGDEERGEGGERGHRRKEEKERGNNRIAVVIDYDTNSQHKRKGHEGYILMNKT